MNHAKKSRGNHLQPRGKFLPGHFTGDGCQRAHGGFGLNRLKTTAIQFEQNGGRESSSADFFLASGCGRN